MTLVLQLVDNRATYHGATYHASHSKCTKAKPNQNNKNDFETQNGECYFEMQFP